MAAVDLVYSRDRLAQRLGLDVGKILMTVLDGGKFVAAEITVGASVRREVTDATDGWEDRLVGLLRQWLEARAAA